MSSTWTHQAGFGGATRGAAAERTPLRRSEVVERTGDAGGALRLTRRGRAVVLLAAVTLLLVAFSLGRVASEASTDGEPPRYTAVVVEQGDTLWSVAQRWAPDADPREVVHQIREVNDLEGSSLRAGQQLLLPARAA